jgi:hypothetical protein
MMNEVPDTAANCTNSFDIVVVAYLHLVFIAVSITA